MVRKFGKGVVLLGVINLQKDHILVDYGNLIHTFYLDDFIRLNVEHHGELFGIIEEFNRGDTHTQNIKLRVFQGGKDDVKLIFIEDILEISHARIT